MIAYEFVTKDGKYILIREPCPGDALSAMRFINTLSNEKMSGILVNKKIPLKDEKSWLRRVLYNIKKKREIFLFALYDDRIIGSCNITRRERKYAHRAVFGIAIERDMRRKGIGTEISKRAIALAQKRLRGLEIIDLAHFAYNRRGHFLYEKLGFKEVARIPYTVKEENRYYGEVVMHLYLRK